jgi:RNA-binding protein
MLNKQQKKHLKTLAHTLKPVVIIGTKGLSESVLSEIDQALTHHELLKIRVNAADREDRQAMIERIGQALQTELISRIGHIATFYRRNPEQSKISFPRK